MITNNRINGLLPAEFSLINSMPVMSYDTTSKHSLSSVLEDKKIDFAMIKNIFTSLSLLLGQLEQYMLEYDYIFLSPEFIFLSPQENTCSFCYCPITEDDAVCLFNDSLKLLTEYLIPKLNYDDRNSVAFIYSLHQKCIDGSLCLSEMLPEYMNMTNGCIIPTASAESDNVNSSADETVENDNIFLPDKPYGEPWIFPALIASAAGFAAGLYMYFGMHIISHTLATVICAICGAAGIFTAVRLIKGRRTDNSNIPEKEITSQPLPDIMSVGETVLLNHSPVLPKPHLIYKGNDFSQDIALKCFPFTIGKLHDSSDFIIDSSLISRMHARFYHKEDAYYVEDLNSSNGTFVNGTPLAPYSMTELNDGDSVTLAHLTYIFKLC